jgi:LPS-assembly lipoprotein
MRALGIVFVALFTLSACGFRPLYQGTNTLAGDASVLDSVEISVNSGSLPQAVKNALIDRFYHHGYPTDAKYVLKVEVQETYRNIIIQKNDTTTRTQLVLRATYQILDRATRQIVDEGSMRAVMAYNNLLSQYTTVVTQNDARDATVRDLADKLTLRTSVVLETKVK